MKPTCVLRMETFSHALSARYYGFPVYLVGSALTDPDPRDIDIVIPIPDAVFDSMYGGPDEGTSADCTSNQGWATFNPPMIWKRWAKDCAKQGLELTLHCGRQVDFKTQPQSMFDGIDKPRRRLDCDVMSTP